MAYRIAARIPTKRRPPLFGGGVLLLLCLALFTGCGKKSMPVPPISVVPVPINDLSYRLDERGVALSWSIPQRTRQGEKLHKVDTYLVYRAVLPESEYCAECPIPFGEPVEVDGARAAIPGTSAMASFSETLLRPEHRYFYMIRSKGGWRYASDDSNIVSFYWDTPPAEPQNLTALGGDHKVRLSWTAITRLLDGREAGEGISYRIFRRRGDDVFQPLEKTTSADEYTDYGVENGQRYVYVVRAVREYKGTPIAGMASSEATALPRDLTPPLPPPSVKAARKNGTVTISWRRVPEPDLAGYRIYRRAAPSDKWERIGEVPAATLLFTDRTPARKNETNMYSVTSIDFEDPPNESTPSPEAKADEDSL